MMKKILVIIPSFQHGGTNRSFCNMIDLYNFKSHNISIDLLSVKGYFDTTYLNEFKRREINILKENLGFSCIYYSGKNIFKRILRKFLKMLPSRAIETILKISCYCYNQKYDAVVSMEEGISTHIASYIKAPQRIVWLRCMYDRYFKLTGEKDETVFYDKFDKIVCVSKECQNSLLQIYPQYRNKTYCIPNTQNREAILKKAQDNTNIIFDQNCFNIVSVGRLDVVKQFHLIPQIVKEMISKNISVRWYIIGEGHFRKTIEESIKEYEVEENVFLIGAKSNPYPIMKSADLIAVTSESESYCNIIKEAIILNQPVISTSFPAVYDTMGNYEKGIICNIKEYPARLSEIISGKPENYCKPDITKNEEDADIQKFISRLENIF